MNDWMKYEEFPDKGDTYCWAELRSANPIRSHKTYIAMCRWWEDSLYDAVDGANVDYNDRIPESRVIGVMLIDEPEPVFVPTNNVRQLNASHD